MIAAFADVGIAWNDSAEFRADRLLDGYGGGLRLLLPFVNMIRVDLAYGEPGEGLTFSIAIQPKPVMQRRRVR